MPTEADPTSMLAALERGDRGAALEAALPAYFGPPCKAAPAGLPRRLARLFSRLEPPRSVRHNHVALPIGTSRVFYVENQSVSEWALADRSEDPAVVRDGSVIEGEPLSGFVIQLVLFEASMGELEHSAGGFMRATDDR